MKYISFGETGTQVSVIGAGCMRIAGMDDQAASAFIHAGLDAGINFFDHADIYGGGRSETIFGNVLAKEPGLRDQLFLQSKCAIHDGMYDFSKEYILNSVDGILSRLQTDHIDSLLLHRPDVLMEPAEVSEAFEELKAAGKVLNFGVSNMSPMQMQLLKSEVKVPLAADQMQLSIVHAPMVESGINVNTSFDGAVMRDGGTLEYCRMNGIAIQAWSPLQIGFFGGVFLGSDKYPELNALLEQIAAEQNTTTDAVAYAWILRIPGKMQVITGTTKPERLAAAASSADIVLSRKQWYDLYKAAGRQLP